MSEATANLRKGGCIILLDVPPGSAITLDGVTRVTPSASTTATEAAKSPLMSDASAPFHRGIWIISGIAAAAAAANSSSSREKGDADFHLLVVRAGMRKDNNATSTTTNGGDCRTLPVGFVLGSPAEDATTTTKSETTELGYHHHHRHHHHDWIFARRYDPRTEEISNESVDELTLNNMVAATGPGGELGKFVIPYDQFTGGRSAKHPNRNSNGNNNNININNDSLLPSWERRTSLIDWQYLRRCHALFHGNKIVPSSENDDGESGGGTTTTTKEDATMSATDDGSTNNSSINAQKIIKDGASVSYPSIPCIDPTVNARRLAQHAGTRAYLSKLSPEKRTALLFGGWDGDDDDDAADTVAPGEYVWKDVLSRHYGRSNENSSEGEDAFLADVELSFLLFLFLECHASLEHWRDAVSMCSLSTAADDAATTTTSMVIRHSQFYQKLLSVLHRQLSCIETEFFQDAEYSSGKDNFMIGALRRLCDACENGGKRKREGDDNNNNNNTVDGLKETSRRLRRLVRDRFGMDLDGPKDDGGDDDDCDNMEIDALAIDVGDEDGYDETGTTDLRDNQDDDSESEEDGPVVVPYDQVEASVTRSSLQPTKASTQTHGKEYPLLYAAMTPEEDEVMTCARILDEAKDVSLVREAAAYLEEVEAHRGAMF